MSQDSSDGDAKITEHEDFAYDDASLHMTSEQTLYKIHRSFVTRLSPYINSLVSGSTDNPVKITIPEDRKVKNADLDELLKHVYHYK